MKECKKINSIMHWKNERKWVEKLSVDVVINFIKDGVESFFDAEVYTDRDDDFEENEIIYCIR